MSATPPSLADVIRQNLGSNIARRAAIQVNAIEAGEKSRLKDNLLLSVTEVHPSPDTRPWFLEVSLSEVESLEKTLTPDDSLLADRKYVAQVAARRDRLEGLYARGITQFESHPTGIGHLLVDIVPDKDQFPFSDQPVVQMDFAALAGGAPERTYTLPLEVPAGLQGNAFVRLWIMGGGASPRLVYLRQVTVSAAAQQGEVRTAASAPSLPVEWLSLDLSSPVNTAVLHVKQIGPNRFAVWPWEPTKECPPLEVELSGVPGGLFAMADDIEEFVTGLAVGSAGEVATWFLSVVEKWGEDTVFLIDDDSGHFIPWEMFPLEDGRLLGEIAVIARWSHFKAFGKTNQLPLKMTETQGQLAALLPGVASEVSAEFRAILEEFAGAPLPEDLDSFDAALLEPLPGEEPVALAYIGSRSFLIHGDEAKILEAIPEWQRLSFYSLTFSDIPRDNVPRALFFVNAPYSGSLLRHSEGSACGFLAALLIRRAVGCIAVQGPPAPLFMEKVAHQFIEQAAAMPEGVHPAALLRDMRSQAIQEVKRARQTRASQVIKTAKAQKRAIFRLVYYGGPGLRLKLIRAGATTGDAIP